MCASPGSGLSRPSSYPRCRGTRSAGSGPLIRRRPSGRLPPTPLRPGRHRSSPINLWYDRPVMAGQAAPFIGFVGSPLHWAFDKSALFGGEAGHLSIVSSGATDLGDAGQRRPDLARDARNGAAAAGRGRREGHARRRRARAAGVVLARAGPARAAAAFARRSPGCIWPATGPIPAFPRRSKAPCSAAIAPLTPCWAPRIASRPRRNMGRHAA